MERGQIEIDDFKYTFIVKTKQAPYKRARPFGNIFGLNDISLRNGMPYHITSNKTDYTEEFADRYPIPDLTCIFSVHSTPDFSDKLLTEYEVFCQLHSCRNLDIYLKSSTLPYFQKCLFLRQQNYFIASRLAVAAMRRSMIALRLIFSVLSR